VVADGTQAVSIYQGAFQNRPSWRLAVYFQFYGQFLVGQRRLAAGL